MYVTVDMLKDFCGKHPDEESGLPQMYLDSALESVSQYLGYDPEPSSFRMTVIGDGCDTLSFPFPVSTVDLVSVDGVPIEDTAWTWTKNYLHAEQAGRRLPFKDGVAYEVSGLKGFERVPSAIVLCVLQIASLLWESAGGNLAVTSTSYADTGTRNFTSFKADRFLDSINAWRIYV